MARVAEILVNGISHPIDAEPQNSLLTVLRDQLGLTGSKYGCGEGQCGTCTVLINGSPRRACITPVGSVGNKPITTIEGLEKNGQLHLLQLAFLDLGAMQCGYCTSGMILSGLALFRTNSDPTEEEIARFMEGNVCRCGTYLRIIAANSKAAQAMKESRQ